MSWCKRHKQYLGGCVGKRSLSRIPGSSDPEHCVVFVCVFLWVKWTRVKVIYRNLKPKLTVVFFFAFWLATRTRHLLLWSNIQFVSLIFFIQLKGFSTSSWPDLWIPSREPLWDLFCFTLFFLRQTKLGIKCSCSSKKCVWWCNATCDSTLLIVIGCMNIHEDMHRGENLRWGNSQTNQPLTSYKDVCADGTFRRCDQNRVRMFGGRRVSSQTVGESK